jgi:hypothetical protein
MTGVMWRLRALLRAYANSVILAAVLAGGAYLLETVAGLHPQAGLSVAQAAGYWFAYGVRGALGAVTRRGGVAPAGNGEPVCRVQPAPEPEVVILVHQGRKIQAIKGYRELNPGTGLKAAKDVIDGLVAQTQLTSPVGRNRARW